MLTSSMVGVLLDHASGPRQTRVVATQLRVLRALKERGLIRFNRPNRPTYSVATTRGREVIAALLARHTDVLAISEMR